MQVYQRLDPHQSFVLCFQAAEMDLEYEQEMMIVNLDVAKGAIDLMSHFEANLLKKKKKKKMS